MGNAKGVRREVEALEKRRFEAMRLLDQGCNLSQTASRLKVARQTVSEWLRQYRQQGPAGLRRAGRAGRKPLLETVYQRIRALARVTRTEQCCLNRDVLSAPYRNDDDAPRKSRQRLTRPELIH